MGVRAEMGREVRKEVGGVEGQLSYPLILFSIRTGKMCLPHFGKPLLL